MTENLQGKTIAVTGATGGLGKELCRGLALRGASLILLDRNAAKSHALRDELQTTYGIDVQCLSVDLEKFDDVVQCTAQLRTMPVDIFIHNAGAYSIPRRICETGYDNVFQINFASPYYMINELMDTLRSRNGHVVVVGSIAHTYSAIDPNDVDFRTRTAASKVYGNAKRYLMFAMYERFRHETAVTFSVVHPGITFTNITAHYPPLIFALIKHPMKVIFMKPQKAVSSLLCGVTQTCGDGEWIGPRLFDIWGSPKKRTLRTVSKEEQRQIGNIADQVYQTLRSLP